MIDIKLEFPKSLTKLAGNSFGLEIYKEQVEQIINNNSNEKFNIIIPERIDRIASSFIQGFFELYVEKYGLYKVKDDIVVESTIPDINNMILENLE